MNFDNLADKEAAREAYYKAGREELMAWAEENGFDVKVPKDNELFLDLDTEGQYEIYKAGVKRLLKDGLVGDWSETVSSSGLPHRHAIVTLVEDMDVYKRLFLQCWLMSDPTRELLSFERAHHGATFPILFLEKK